MAKIKFRPPTDEDIYQLGQQLRQQDLEELAVSCQLSPDEAVLQSVLASDPEFLFAAHINNQLICIGGCSTIGVPWLLGTDLLNTVAYSLTRKARTEVQRMLAKYGVLQNVIDARQHKTRRWLSALGFEWGDTVEIVSGYPLILFYRRADYV